MTCVLEIIIIVTSVSLVNGVQPHAAHIGLMQPMSLTVFIQSASDAVDRCRRGKPGHSEGMGPGRGSGVCRSGVCGYLNRIIG